jgi:erythromycin esterase-like protein
MLDATTENILTSHLQPIEGDFANTISTLLTAVGEAQVVMIGEMTHGTDEFYRYRAELTKRLIKEKGFTFVGIEGDWPDSQRVDTFVKGRTKTDVCAADSLDNFKRYPQWMWRNFILEEFISWLKSENDQRKEDKVGFHGLDLYSLSAMDSVINYLDQVDKAAAGRARSRYGIFKQYEGKENQYNKDLQSNSIKSCEEDVKYVLQELLLKENDYVKPQNLLSSDEYFGAVQNARVVKGAEEYHRSSHLGGNTTWNIRDSHMCETVKHLVAHYKKSGYKSAKAVLWAHNSHIGDARATQFGEGEFNLGQLVREHFEIDKTFNVGFSTYCGTVTGSLEWGWPYEFFPLSLPETDTYEALFHQIFPGNFLLLFRTNNPQVPLSNELIKLLIAAKYQRMIGVNYRSETERKSHYVSSCLPYQFDAFIHFDETTALLPLDM